MDDAVGESGQPFLSVVIPAFDEAARIAPTLDKLELFLAAQSFSWEIVVVDDGSSDDTAALVERWAKARDDVRLVRIEHAGKGWAVRTGMLEARGVYRFMCDAALAMPAHRTSAFIERMETGIDVVIGSREAAGSRRFDEPGYRHLMGRVFNRVARTLAVGGFEDTQCGFKCFSQEAATKLFELQVAKGMGFDVEILYLAVKAGFTIEELPIDWYHQPVSKVRPGIDTLDMLKDTVLIRLRDAFGKYGDLRSR